MDRQISAFGIMQSIHTVKFTGQQVVINIQILIREGCFHFLIELIDHLIADIDGIIRHRIDRHYIKVSFRIFCEKLLIIRNVLIDLGQIVDTKIKNNGC